MNMIYLNIGKLLKETGKSKYALVQALRSNYTVINNMIEQNTTGIKFETIEILCKFFDCAPSDLFTIE